MCYNNHFFSDHDCLTCIYLKQSLACVQLRTTLAIFLGGFGLPMLNLVFPKFGPNFTDILLYCQLLCSNLHTQHHAQYRCSVNSPTIHLQQHFQYSGVDSDTRRSIWFFQNLDSISQTSIYIASFCIQNSTRNTMRNTDAVPIYPQFTFNFLFSFIVCHLQLANLVIQNAVYCPSSYQIIVIRSGSYSLPYLHCLTE